MSLPDGIGDWFALSPGQEAIWLHLPFVHPATYQIACYGHVATAPDAAMLAQALAEAMRRHDALRLQIDPAEPRQRVLAALPVPLRFIDLPDGVSAPHEAFLRDLLLTPFELAKPPYFECVVARGGALGAWWVLRFHHLIVDATGAMSATRDLADIYGVLAGGIKPPVRPAPSFAAFAAAELSHARSPEGQEDLAFWTGVLGAPWEPVFAARGTPEPRAAGWSSDMQRLVIHLEDHRRFRARCQEAGVLPVQAWVALAGLLGTAISGAQTTVIGVPMRNRTIWTARLVGMCNGVAFVPVDTGRAANLGELAVIAGRDLTAAHPRQRIALAALAGALGVSATRDQRLYDIMVSYMPAGGIRRKLELGSPSYASFVVGPDPNPVSLYIGEGADADEATEVGVSFNPNFLTRDDARRLLDGLQRMIATFLDDPAAPLSAYRPFTPSEAAAIGRRPVRPLRLRVSASFTADPIAPGLGFWAGRFGVPATVEMAGYGQLFQEMLDPRSGSRQNTGGINLLLLRLEDWAREIADPDDAIKLVESTAADFVEALTAAARANPVPHLLVIAPPSPDWDAGGARQVGQIGAEAVLRQGIRRLATVHLLPWRELRRLYPLPREADEVTDRLGHVPFTPACYLALATLAMRRLHLLRRRPVKVIAVDCDNTLWRGVVGEDGVQGIVLAPSHLRLQARLMQAASAGVLVCMVSKNLEADVLAVFARRPDMVLRLDAVTAHRVNWEPKSRNLISLAGELGLALDSFVFLDDNEAEIAEVMAHCPAVESIAVPVEESGRLRFVDHLWALDASGGTEEDRRRTQMYRENHAREDLRRGIADYASFIARLGVRIRIAAPMAAQVSRLAQLTERTTQFNINGIRRDEAAILRLLDDPNVAVRAVSVADRFGDYGLVGLLIAHAQAGTLEVDTLLMSCRVLGRGVEHGMIAELGQIALAADCVRVGIDLRVVPRNLPVRQFLATLPFQRAGAEPMLRLTLDSEAAAATVFQPESHVPIQAPVETGEAASAASASAALWLEAAGALSEISAIEAALAAGAQGPADRDGMAALLTASERAIAAIWQDLLGRGVVGPNEDFFALGGTSLGCIQMLSRVKAALGVELPLRAVFATPTVAGLAALVDGDAETSPLRASGFWQRETLLPEALRFTGAPPALAMVGDILLTGATGFLGAFLSVELLRTTQARLHCLVRATTLAEASQRLRDNLRRYSGWDDRFADRIMPVLGDLAEPQLGIEASAWDTLSRRVSAVFHNGALVNFVYPYERLKAANVGGTLEVLRFVAQGTPKALHYVSSTAILAEEDADHLGVLREDAVPAHPEHLWNGYAQSKYVAERLVLAAVERGLSGGIYRLGPIAAHSETGVFQQEDFIFRMVRACIAVRAVPDVVDVLAMVPVDFVARALVGIAAREPAKAAVFHIDDPAPMTSPVLYAALRSFGYEVELCAFAVWRDMIVAAGARDPVAVPPDVALAMQRQDELERMRRTRRLRVDAQRAIDVLRSQGIHPPAIDEAHLHRTLAFFVSTGFIPRPAPMLACVS